MHAADVSTGDHYKEGNEMLTQADREIFHDCVILNERNDLIGGYSKNFSQTLESLEFFWTGIVPH